MRFYMCAHKSAVFYTLGSLFIESPTSSSGLWTSFIGTPSIHWHNDYASSMRSLQSLSSSTCPSCTGACRSRTCRHGRTLRPTTRCQSGTSGSPPDSAPKHRFLIKEEKDPNPELPEFPSLAFITKGPPLSPSQESPRWLSSGRYPATCPRTLLWLPKAENSLLLT